MEVALWAIIAGSLLVLMALSASALKHLPVSTAMFYLLVGLAVGPLWLGLARIHPLVDARLVEHLTELVVVVSLFSVGLKLNVELADGRWLLPLRLALGSMVITVGLIALAGIAMGLPLGAAVLLGAILAPTDPVLASDVQVSDPEDTSRLRFALTGEGGLNDGAAFPFVMLGLGLLGLHPLGEWGERWFLVDVVWAVFGGLAIGGALGMLMGRVVLYLRTRHEHAVGYDDFLALGLIALSYGAALLATTYGFLAVFAAGVALRRVERRKSTANRTAGHQLTPGSTALAEQAMSTPAPAVEADVVATHPVHAAAFMAHAMLGSTERIERIGEVAAVVLLGAMLWAVDGSLVTWWFVPLLFLVIRPLAVTIGLAGSGVPRSQKRLMAWFGVRGIGSLYYLSYAVTHGLDPTLANTLVALTLASIVASILAHGISVTPLMKRYEKRRQREKPSNDGGA
jgi:NhaP-type Na+/H+ or K+/H+ antiporter